MGEVLPDSDQKSSTTVSPTEKQQALYLTKQAWRRFMIVVRAPKTYLHWQRHLSSPVKAFDNPTRKGHMGL